MKSGHEEIKEMLPEYLNGSLTEDTRNNIETHLKECKECRDELAFISGLVSVDVPDPGDLFWQTLPQMVRGAVEKEGVDRFSPRRLLLRPLPVAAAVAAMLLLVFTYMYTKKEEPPELYTFFNDSFTVAVLDYNGITERDIPLITESLINDELYLISENLTGHSYYREFSSLGSKEMEGLYEALKKEQLTGG